MTFNENDTYNVVRVDPKKGTIQTKLELLEGEDNTSYKIYYKRGWASSYSLGESIYNLDVGELTGPHDIVYQTGWRNWDIKTVQTNNLSSTTFRVNETIKLK